MRWENKASFDFLLSAKNYQNPFMCVKVIALQSCPFFRPTLYALSLSLFSLLL